MAVRLLYIFTILVLFSSCFSKREQLVKYQEVGALNNKLSLSVPDSWQKADDRLFTDEPDCYITRSIFFSEDTSAIVRIDLLNFDKEYNEKKGKSPDFAAAIKWQSHHIKDVCPNVVISDSGKVIINETQYYQLRYLEPDGQRECKKLIHVASNKTLLINIEAKNTNPQKFDKMVDEIVNSIKLPDNL